QTVEMLAFSAGDVRMALKLADIRGVAVCPPVIAAPSSARALLGLGALRGVVAGLYSLAMLRGGAKSPLAGQWVIACGDGSVGLVFDELAGYARVAAAAAGAVAGKDEGFVEIGGQPHLLVDVAAALREITGAPARAGGNQRSE